MTDQYKQLLDQEDFERNRRILTGQKSVNDIQHGGTHYKNRGIQPWDYVAANNLGYFEGTAIKYLTRWKDKGGVEDLRKAVHFIEKLIEINTSESK